MSIIFLMHLDKSCTSCTRNVGTEGIAITYETRQYSNLALALTIVVCVREL